MRVILNIIWLIFGGLWFALGYALAGIPCFVRIITIPFGFAAFRIASNALWPVSLVPLGQEIVPVDDPWTPDRRAAV